jgi:transposase
VDHGAGEWLADRHGQRARRGWRKLHLAVDTNSGQIVAVTLTNQEIDDASQVDPLLGQTLGEIEQVTADGAYDGEPTYAAIATRDPDIAVVIPPRTSSMQPIDLGTDASRRDVHVRTVAALGGLGWQEVTGYGRRALVKTTMGRYKALIGPPHRSGSRCGRPEPHARGRTPELRSRRARCELTSWGKGNSRPAPPRCTNARRFFRRWT